MSNKLSLHDEVGGVARLEVLVGDAHVVALISEATWRARFGTGNSDASFREQLLANQAAIESAVVRKATPMSRDQVVLRASDFI